ncbi:MAG: transposase family protein [Burkholderiales bacterium]|nr:transposase family protein [Burkholderiales bacterium]
MGNKRNNFFHDAAERKELHLLIGFTKGTRFPDEAGQLCSVHDIVERQWQHLNFFEHTCYLHRASRLCKSNYESNYLSNSINHHSLSFNVGRIFFGA